MSRTTRAVPRKRGSCRDARSGRKPTGCRQPARNCYGISRPATLPDCRHRAAPTARETTRTGKVIAIRTGRRTGCIRRLAPGRPGERVTPLDSAAASRRPQRLAAPFESVRFPNSRRKTRSTSCAPRILHRPAGGEHRTRTSLVLVRMMLSGRWSKCSDNSGFAEKHALSAELRCAQHGRAVCSVVTLSSWRPDLRVHTRS